MKQLLRFVLSGSALALVASCFFCLTASAVHVKSYTKKDGTYVPAHERTAPNHTKNDNYSTTGNVNPYTGKTGTKPRDAEPAATTVASTASTSTATSAAPTTPVGNTASDNEPVYITIPRAPLKPGTIIDLKGGMTETELKQVLGSPNAVEGKGSYEIWTYPSGTVYFSPKAGVMAWKENKLIVISEKSVPAQPTK